MAMATKTKPAIQTLVSSPSVFFFLLLQRRGLAVWSMKKDPALEAALFRNRRWIVNNQIKHLLLRLPSRVAPVRSLQRMYKTLDQRGRALNWLRKYPSCFDTFPDPGGGGGGGDGELFFGFTKRMAALVAEEEAALDASEPAMARRLAKLLMLARDRRIRVAKLGELKRALGLPDDYLLRLLPNHPDLFRLVNPYGPCSAMEIELARWAPDLAVSAVEAAAAASGAEAPPPRFVCSLPHSWVRSRARFDEFNEGTPYVSPYAEDWAASPAMADSEKRAVGVVHELLSLTLYKKLSIVKLEHFRRRQLANLEKRRKRGEIVSKQVKEEEDCDQVSALDTVEKREERKRFYKVLFDEN
ncbi:LOW QUALITY PROTEIN: protein ROOT PRIMORDIUM DEFECTIVE 1 [Ananas comosus]|uniref:LOW QUALITY PROTEIN: protein ROOT PRIMORDIUM DEFECTIVE 1 n=1 Tax=Ananas comosus TaxID=4615 RepID=A0A6P5FBK7_ANACO|nr:LOW QUALITY PROTEIN: protein ROOT PRIMORDIUM DEFECTIVE 1 [Ananas comosus]